MTRIFNLGDSISDSELRLFTDTVDYVNSENSDYSVKRYDDKYNVGYVFETDLDTMRHTLVMRFVSDNFSDAVDSVMRQYLIDAYMFDEFYDLSA